MKFKSQALHVITIKYWKADGSGNPPSLIPALWKIAIYVIKTKLYVLFCTRGFLDKPSLTIDVFTLNSSLVLDLNLHFWKHDIFYFLDFNTVSITIFSLLPGQQRLLLRNLPIYKKCETTSTATVLSVLTKQDIGNNLICEFIQSCYITTFENNNVLLTIQGFPKNKQKINESAKIVSFEKIFPTKCHFAGQTRNLFNEHKT